MPDTINQPLEQVETEGKSTMIIAIGDAVAGVIALANRPRADANATLQRLWAYRHSGDVVADRRQTARG